MAVASIITVIARSVDVIPDDDTPVMDRCSPVTFTDSAARDFRTEAAAPDSWNVAAAACINPVTRAKCRTQIRVMTVDVLQVVLRTVPAQDAPTQAWP
jgi:hypothetical protein